MQRKHGHVAGYVSLGLSVATTVWGFASNHIGPGLVLGALTLGVGSHLLTKLYLDDPAAVAEYRSKFFARPLKDSFKEFKNVATMVRIVDADDVRDKFEREYASGYIAVPVAALGITAIQDMLKADIAHQRTLQKMFARDAGRAESFSELWFSLASPCGEALPKLHEMRVADADQCAQLLQQEYTWVDIYSGTPRPSAPGGETVVVPGGKQGVWKAMLQYSAFLCNVLNTSPLFVQAVLQSCPFGEASKMSVLMQHGLVSHFKKGYLDRNYCTMKFRQQVHTESMSVWDAESVLNLPELLEARVIESAEATHLFERAVPTGRFGEGKANNVVDYIQHFERVFRSCPELVAPHLRTAMHSAYTEFQDYDRTFERDLDRLRRECDAAVAKFKEAQKAQKEEERKRFREHEADLRRQRTQYKQRCHDNFVSALHGGGGGGYGARASMECQHM